MYNTLELGHAGTDEWLAASKDMKLLNNAYSGLVTYEGQEAQGVFTQSDFEQSLRKVSRRVPTSESDAETK